MSSYERVQAVCAARMASVNGKRNMPHHVRLVEMIEADRHLLVGARAMAMYVEQRFTEDTDYLVGHKTFQKVRRWFKQQGVEHDDTGEAIRSTALGLDVIDASNNPVLAEMLKHENGVPSPEALAATKYVAVLRVTRQQWKLHHDIADLIRLVGLKAFDAAKFLGYLVERYAEQRPHAEELINQIHRGDKPVVI